MEMTKKVTSSENLKPPFRYKIRLTSSESRDLCLAAKCIRKRFLQMHFEAQSGHIGTGLSAIDLLAYIYTKWLKPEDRFILSKGHAASALYATLHYAGFLSEEELKTYYKEGTLLPAHPAAGAHIQIPAATGSLGHGFSIATGMAFANKYYQKSDARVVCLLSDGECNEGAVWEAALFSAHHRLKNITVVVDANGLQGFGRTKDVMNLDPFCKKWEAFGFKVIEVDGHDFAQIDAGFQLKTDRPKCIIAHTIKGKGVSFMEDRLEWHYLPMDIAQFELANEELEAI